MITRIHASLALALALAALGPAPSSAFSRTSIRPRPAFSVGSSPASPPTTSLSTTSLSSHAVESEEDAVWLMTKARECALSDTCSIDDAAGYLKDVMHVQSSCVAGTLAGPEACDVGLAAEVVAALRAKVGSSRVGSSGVTASNGALAIDIPSSSMQAGFLTMFFLYAALVLSSTYLGSLSSSSQLPLDVVPFTPQEVWWSIRDGYFGDMVSHFVHNGGLLVGMDNVKDVVVPFTPQEVWWSIRDGYFGDLISHSMHNGGLLVGVNEMGDMALPAVPFTPQEVWWSIRDGYFGDLMSHSMRNGGLLVSANEVEELSSTPVTGEEWMWAMRDGYVGNMVSHVFRNGGI